MGLWKNIGIGVAVILVLALLIWILKKIFGGADKALRDHEKMVVKRHTAGDQPTVAPP